MPAPRAGGIPVATVTVSGNSEPNKSDVERRDVLRVIAGRSANENRMLWVKIAIQCEKLTKLA